MKPLNGVYTGAAHKVGRAFSKGCATGPEYAKAGQREIGEGFDSLIYIVYRCSLATHIRYHKYASGKMLL